MNTSLRFLLMTVVVFLVGCSLPIPQSSIDSAWNPPVLSKEGCPNIDGKYQDKGSLERLFEFRRPIMPYQSRDPRELERLPVTYTFSRNITPSGLSIKESSARIRAFNAQAVTSIQKRERTIAVVLMDGVGAEYTKATLKLDHPQVGCYNGALVIRMQYRTSGGEGKPGFEIAGEFEYRKLNDGSLQVIVRRREWSRQIAEYPRETETTLLFPPAP